MAGDAATFRTRFQQLTGPLMAKSVEDTLFFRQNMELALNEVGAEPMPRTFSLNRFHAEMKTRLERQPDALSGTSTHDTKRGEDARARLYTLTEAPEQWAECVARWRQMNREKVVQLDDGAAPKPAVARMLYQALVGVWPTTLRPDDEAGLKALEERFLAFTEKALREAKLRTNWGDSNDAYETAVLDYARHLLSPANQTFLQDFYRTIQPFVRAGLINSLTQTIIKLTAPGVPDIYQGSEGLNFSLVDPDNRREPDFATLEQWLADDEAPTTGNEQNWLSGAEAACHREAAALPSAEADAVPQRRLPAARRHRQARRKRHCLCARAGRRGADRHRAAHGAERVARGSGAAAAGTLERNGDPLPASLANRRYRDILSGEELFLTDRISMETVDCCSSVVLVTL